MATYTNMGHGMATVIFTDGDGLILKRGERRDDNRTVRWIDKGVAVVNAASNVVKPKKEDKDKVLNKE